MRIYQAAHHDTRVRDYLFTRRVIWSENTVNAGLLVGNREFQAQITSANPVTEILTGGSLLLDFGIEFHGAVRFVTGSAAGKIRLRFGESVSEAMGCPDQDHAIHDAELVLPRMGMLEYGNTAFRFVRIDALDRNVQLINVHGVALYRDQKVTGAFHSSDERLNRIWDTAIYTVRMNMQDFLYDGAKRDRLVFMGDLHPEAKAVFCAFDDVSIVPDSMDFIVSHSADTADMNRIRSYPFWWVITLHDYYWRTADISYLARQRDLLLELLAVFAGYVDSAGSEQVPECRFLDWPNREKTAAMHAGLQGLLFWALKCGEALCAVLDIAFPGAAADAVRRMKNHLPDCGDSKAAAAMLTLSGLKNRADVVSRNRFSGVSTFFGYYMLQTLPTGPALELIRRYWGAMLDFGATTFWEDIDLTWTRNAGRIDELPQPGKDDLHADFGNFCYKGLRHSLCHGWAAGPAPFLSERVLGVRFLEPGGRRIEVAPELGGLEFVSGVVPSAFGPIRVTADAGGEVEVKAGENIIVEISKEKEALCV